MAIKGGQIIHAGNGNLVIDRIQTGGPGQLNIPTEKIYELGNYKSVATVRDTPDLTFSLESFDVSTEIEAMLAGQAQTRNFTGDMPAGNTLTATDANFTSADVGTQIVVEGAGPAGADLNTTISGVTNATTATLADAATTAVNGAQVELSQAGGIDLAKAVPIDIASQFKAGQNAPEPFKVISSIAAPFLYVEQMSYRFGLRDNATQTAQLRGDTIFYNPGATFTQTVAGTGVAGQTIATSNPAYQVAEGDNRRVLAVTAGTKRLSFGADYTETYGGVGADGAAVTTVTIDEAVPTNQNIRIVYSSPSQVDYPQSVHPSVVVKPAAVKGRDIEIYLGGYDPDDVAGSQVNKLTSVQAANVDWRVTIEKDEEFGNAYAVGQDFDVPQVNGSIDIKPRDPAELLALLRKAAGVTDPNAVLGTKSSVPLPMDIVVKNPDDNDRTMKRLHVPDARFTPPGVSGRVQQKLTTSLPFESDEGTLLVYSR